MKLEVYSNDSKIVFKTVYYFNDKITIIQIKILNTYRIGAIFYILIKYQ